MDNLLPSVINTYSNMSRSVVRDLVRDMKVEKNDLSSLVSKIRSFDSSGYFPSTIIRRFSLLDSEILKDLFRDTDIRFDRLFAGANSIGLALSSFQSFFEEEIKKVEKDIHDLETFIDNYEYIAGKQDGYDLFYVEDFDSETLDYRSDGIAFTLSDRDGQNFPDGGGYHIDNALSSMKIGKIGKKINVLDNISEILYETNYSNYISSFTDPKRLFNDKFNETWYVSVDSPVILKTEPNSNSSAVSLEENFGFGAKTRLSVILRKPVKMSSLKIHPDSFTGMSINQIEIIGVDGIDVFDGYEENSVSATQLLKKPVYLRGVFEVGFDEVLVHKIVFTFNQPAYVKSKLMPLYSEKYAKSLAGILSRARDARMKSFSVFQDMVYTFFLKNDTVKGLRENRQVIGSYYSNRFPSSRRNPIHSSVSAGLVSESEHLDDLAVFSKYSPVYTLVKSMFEAVYDEAKIFQDDVHIEGLSSAFDVSNYTSAPVFSRLSNSKLNHVDHQFDNEIIAAERLSSLSQNFYLEQKPNMYEYKFGLRAIEFMLDDRENVLGDLAETSDPELADVDDRQDDPFAASNYDKACFVSPRIARGHHVEAVKVSLQKSGAAQSLSVPRDEKYDLENLFSHEISISNIEFPDSEDDWLPIAQSNNFSVDSEVVFFGGNRTGRLRFPSLFGTVLLYRNGIELLPTSFEIFEDAQTIKVFTDVTISASDIMVAKYQIDPARANADVLDLFEAGVFNEVATNYRTSSGEGQHFDSSNQMNHVLLDYVPYVSRRNIANATYSTLAGTIFPENFAGYSPVKVLIDNRNFAINLTNYTNSGQRPNLNSEELTLFNDGVYFIQSGRKLTFNRPITSSFRVYYEYVPSNLRFRIISRKNVPNIIGSSSVDSVLVKMKTRTYDPYYDKLKFISSV